MAGPVLGPTTSTKVPKPAANASLDSRSMTASPNGPTGARGLTLRSGEPGLPQDHQRGSAACLVLRHPPSVERRWPTSSPAEAGEEHMVAGMHPVVGQGVVEGEGMEADEVLP